MDTIRNQTGKQQTAEARRRRRALQRERRARTVRRQKIMAVLAAVILAAAVSGGVRLVKKAWAGSSLSEAVLSYRSTVARYAEQEGIGGYVDTLLAIMMVETKGEGNDVMQSSESKGLAPGSLGPEESIEQACIYFAALLQIARDLDIDDAGAVIQSYNYGPGYLHYVAENGGRHGQELAIEYAREQSGGEKISYLHLYAIQENGGWIYKFGNMFYEALVQQYL